MDISQNSEYKIECSPFCFQAIYYKMLIKTYLINFFVNRNIHACKVDNSNIGDELCKQRRVWTMLRYMFSVMLTSYVASLNYLNDSRHLGNMFIRYGCCYQDRIYIIQFEHNGVDINNFNKENKKISIFKFNRIIHQMVFLNCKYIQINCKP